MGANDKPTQAVLLRRITYRESDLIVQLFTERLGKVTALARGARKSRTRFSGSLEAMHTLEVELVEPRRGDWFELRSSHLHKPRIQLTLELERMNAAARMLGWVRKAAPERTPEPVIYSSVEACLDELDQNTSMNPRMWIAVTGLRLLSDFGWAQQFDACVGCGKPCPSERAAWLDPKRGGLVCSACGGGPLRLSGAQRVRLQQASRGEARELDESDVDIALRLVDDALSLHADIR